MAGPSTHLRRLVLPLVGAAALLLAASPLPGELSAGSTATVVSNVKKPRPVKRSIQKAGRAGKSAVKRVAKRPAKVAPKRPAAAPRSRVAAQPTPNDPLWSSSWSLTRTNVPAAWNLTPGVAETVVAVLDTGVDLTHPDLQGAVVPGYDAVNRDDDPTDDHGHGTMVAGVVAARANNALGGAGVCAGCSVMPVKVIAGNGSGTAADIADGIRWATEHGADIVNMSFALSGPDDGVAQAHPGVAREHRDHLGEPGAVAPRFWQFLGDIHRQCLVLFLHLGLRQRDDLVDHIPDRYIARFEAQVSALDA